MHKARTVGLWLGVAMALAACAGPGATGQAVGEADGDAVARDTAGGDLAGTDAAPDTAGPDTADAPAAPDAGPPDAGPACEPAPRWTPGTAAFSEATQAWGLAAIGAQGALLNAVDFDGDGWTDLIVRRGGVRVDDFGPDGARHTWLLRNTGAGFEDVTEASGVLTTRLAHDGALGRPGEVYAAGDVDNDGDLDLYSGVSTADLTATLGETSELLLGQGDGTFALGPATSAVRRDGGVDVPSSASFVDVDRDGVLDLWLPQHNFTPAGTSALALVQDRLYQGDGAGGFTEITYDVGLPTQGWSSFSAINDGLAHTRAWSGAACDLNGDGAMELLAASYGRAPNHLWQASWAPGTVYFFNRSVASGYAYDDDLGWTDNQNARCYCQGDPTAEGCAGLPAPQIGCPNPPNWSHDSDREPFRLGGNSGATVCADLDNDGDIDLLTNEIKHWWAGSGADGSEALINTGAFDVAFERPGDQALGLAIAHTTVRWDEGHMTSSVLDFDNDGWLDVYQGASDYAGNRGLLYHQAAPLSFVEVATADFFEHNRSHGVAIADFDRDGDVDVIVGHSRARCDAAEPNDCYPTAQVRAFENTFGQSGHWLQLSLTGGPGTNRAAIGARVRVTAGGVTQTQEVGGGYGLYGAQNDLTLHFGLGDACAAEVEVRWPDAALTTETFTLASAARWAVTQGQPAARAPAGAPGATP